MSLKVVSGIEEIHEISEKLSQEYARKQQNEKQSTEDLCERVATLESTINDIVSLTTELQKAHDNLVLDLVELQKAHNSLDDIVLDLIPNRG